MANRAISILSGQKPCNRIILKEKFTQNWPVFLIIELQRKIECRGEFEHGLNSCENES